MIRQKRGQATAFVIMGLVLVALTILVVYFRVEIMETFTKRTIAETPVASQAARVDTYVKNCLDNLAEEAVETLGMQGGFITVPEDEFPPLPYNMLSNALDVFGNGALLVPYWYYRTPNNLEKTYIPTKQSMETEIATYIDGNLDACLNGFLPLILLGYSTAAGQPSTTVFIGENQVVTETKMDVSVAFKEQFFDFDTFKTATEVPLGKLYDQAREIFAYENEQFFIENTTIDFMAMYDEIPFTTLDFECSPRTWLKTQVALDLKRILALNIPSLKIERTDFVSTNSYDDALTFDALKGSARDLTVSFRFAESWPIMFDVVGEDNEVLRGKPFSTDNEASRFLMPLFCLNEYHFVYDVKYPILIALAEDDYIFQFGLMAVIDNNQARTNQVALPVQFDGDDRICDNKPTRLQVIAQGIAADGTQVPLEGVDISLQCIGVSCDIGKTSREQLGNMLTTQFPACVNAQLIARKEGYHPAEETLDTNEEATVSVTLEPYYELPIELSIQDETGTRTPYPTEEVLFMFEHNDVDYYTTAYYPAQDTVKLIAGSYTVTSTLTVQTPSGFTLEDEKIRVCVDAPKESILGLFGATEKECTQETIEGTTLDAVVSGGGSYDWFAQRQGLAEATKIKLFTVRGTTPTTYSELAKYTSEPEQFSETVKKPILA